MIACTTHSRTVISYMKVFKFGGASVKDAAAVINVGKIIESFDEERLVVVVSAMGKMTNAFEKLLSAYREDSSVRTKLFNEIKDFHTQILDELFPDNGMLARTQIANIFTDLENELKQTPASYGYDYDRIVPYGELLSTQIIHHWLQEYGGHQSIWHDTRNLLITNNYHRRATVNWELTNANINKAIKANGVHLVQGFIGSDGHGNTTTLGREGSDYTASVFAYCLDAEGVTIWKDVPGILNGDPKVFDNTIQIESISYREAIELAYFGASVIHPKTIQPVQRKNIPLYIRSFVQPQMAPTVIKKGLDLHPKVACFIRKTNQALVTVSSHDLAFIVEDHLAMIYQVFHEFGITVNMMQNSAVSTSFCVNQDLRVLPDAIRKLAKTFEVKFNKDLMLFTVRHHNPETVAAINKNKNVLLEQVTRETYQVVVS